MNRLDPDVPRTGASVEDYSALLNKRRSQNDGAYARESNAQCQRGERHDEQNVAGIIRLGWPCGSIGASTRLNSHHVAKGGINSKGATAVAIGPGGTTTAVEPAFRCSFGFMLWPGSSQVPTA